MCIRELVYCSSICSWLKLNQYWKNRISKWKVASFPWFGVRYSHNIHTQKCWMHGVLALTFSTLVARCLPYELLCWDVDDGTVSKCSIFKHIFSRSLTLYYVRVHSFTLNPQMLTFIVFLSTHFPIWWLMVALFSIFRCVFPVSCALCVCCFLSWLSMASKFKICYAQTQRAAWIDVKIPQSNA